MDETVAAAVEAAEAVAEAHEEATEIVAEAAVDTAAAAVALAETVAAEAEIEAAATVREIEVEQAAWREDANQRLSTLEMSLNNLAASMLVMTEQLSSIQAMLTGLQMQETETQEMVSEATETEVVEPEAAAHHENVEDNQEQHRRKHRWM
jgi:hypothetical protein